MRAKPAEYGFLQFIDNNQGDICSAPVFIPIMLGPGTQTIPRPAPPPYTAPAPAPAPVNRIISPGAGRCGAGRGGFVNTATFVNTIMAKVPTRSGWKLLFVQPQIENIILVINMSSLKIYIYLQHLNVCQYL